MNIGEIIQNVATGSAVVLGITYIVGGLIVNLNLARRGEGQRAACPGGFSGCSSRRL